MLPRFTSRFTKPDQRRGDVPARVTSLWPAVLATVLLAGGACARAPRVEESSDPPDLTQLRASMQNIFMAQEVYYSYPPHSYTYASDAAALASFHAAHGCAPDAPPSCPRYTPQPGARLTIFEGTQKGWSGMLEDASGVACVIFVGEVARKPVTPRRTAASEARIPACDRAR